MGICKCLQMSQRSQYQNVLLVQLPLVFFQIFNEKHGDGHDVLVTRPGWSTSNLKRKMQQKIKNGMMDDVLQFGTIPIPNFKVCCPSFP